jgi:hypothetical protein
MTSRWTGPGEVPKDRRPAALLPWMAQAAVLFLVAARSSEPDRASGEAETAAPRLPVPHHSRKKQA